MIDNMGSLALLMREFNQLPIRETQILITQAIELEQITLYKEIFCLMKI